MAVHYRHVNIEPLFGEDRKHLAAGHDEVGGLVASRHGHPPRVHCGQG
jgi:hypothetical protein